MLIGSSRVLVDWHLHDARGFLALPDQPLQLLHRSWRKQLLPGVQIDAGRDVFDDVPLTVDDQGIGDDDRGR